MCNTGTLAVYAGTFDPPTLGHQWMIERGAELFTQLIVAVGVNPEKRCMFSVEERLEMLRRSTENMPNVAVHSFQNQYLVLYAGSLGARFVLRGIRTVGDFEFERAMRHINSDLGSAITTVFLMPPREIVEVSSSMVKGLVGPEEWEEVVGRFVSPFVLLKLKEVHHARTR